VYGADGRLLLHGRQVTVFLIRNMCPVRIGRVKSRRFTVGIELRQGCVPGGNRGGAFEAFVPPENSKTAILTFAEIFKD